MLGAIAAPRAAHAVLNSERGGAGAKRLHSARGLLLRYAAVALFSSAATAAALLLLRSDPRPAHAVPPASVVPPAQATEQLAAASAAVASELSLSHGKLRNEALLALSTDLTRLFDELTGAVAVAEKKLAKPSAAAAAAGAAAAAEAAAKAPLGPAHVALPASASAQLDDESVSAGSGSMLRAMLATRECVACAAPAPPPSAVLSQSDCRGSRQQIDTYLRLALSDQIGGFLNIPSYVAFAVIAKAQRDAGVAGAVGEIGLHHGRSFILAALLAGRSEPLFALDLFEELQELNTDKSGSGSFEALGRNLKGVGLDIKNVSIAKMSSADLPPSYFCDLRMPRFRWFSVDGGHTELLTRLDISTGLCHLADGGVIAVDDVFNNLFTGVTEGIFSALAFNRERLAPFLIITGKLYLTTASHHARYFAAARNFFVPRYGAYTNARQSVLWGWQTVTFAVPLHASIESRIEAKPGVKADIESVLGMSA